MKFLFCKIDEPFGSNYFVHGKQLLCAKMICRSLLVHWVMASLSPGCLTAMSCGMIKMDTQILNMLILLEIECLYACNV